MVEPANDNLRCWYDEKTNTNIQFKMFLFFVSYHLMPSGIFNTREFGMGFFWGC